VNFTLPSIFWPIFQQNRHLLNDLPAIGAAAINQWMKCKHGVRAVLIAVPQSFGGFLNFNPHLHMLVSAGGLKEDDGRWIAPVHLVKSELMQMWRFALVAYLWAALRAGVIRSALQSLEDCEWEGMEAPPKGSDWFRAEDMNFDGYKDVYVLTNWGATGNQLGYIWLYDPASGHFEYSKEFSELGTLAIDHATKTITTHGNGGMAGRVFRAAKYIVQDNRPVLIITVAQDYDFKTKKYHCIVQHRHEGRFVTIRDVWAEAKSDFDAPCDAGDPFRGIGDK
jgi:hypothetical protein